MDYLENLAELADENVGNVYGFVIDPQENYK
jgi:hypothetical protein